MAEVGKLIERLRKPTTVTIFDGDTKNAGRIRKLCQADREIREAAASTLTALQERVAELEKAGLLLLSEIDAPNDYESIVHATGPLRAALKAGG